MVVVAKTVAERRKEKLKKRHGKVVVNWNCVDYYKKAFIKTIEEISEEIDELDKNLRNKGELPLMQLALPPTPIVIRTTRAIASIDLHAISYYPYDLRMRVQDADDEIHEELERLQCEMKTLEEFYAMKPKQRKELAQKWESARSFLKGKKILFKELHDEWQEIKEKMLEKSKVILSKFFDHEIILLEEKPEDAQEGQDDGQVDGMDDGQSD